MTSDAAKRPADISLDTSAPPRSSNWRRALSAAVFAFVLSRVLILLSAALTIAIAQQWKGMGSDPQDIRLFTPEAVAHLHSIAFANDAGWYSTIVSRGYETRPFDTSAQANWAFFPLHPLLWNSLTWLGLDMRNAGLVLVNLLFLVALIQVHRWVQVMRDEATATRAIVCLALFPTSYFFSLPWSESLFVLLSASSLLAIEQRRWGNSTVFNALASATRPTGVFLSALMWWEAREGHRLPPPKIWLFAVLGLSGLFAFMALLWHKTGNPFAFSDIQTTWGRESVTLRRMLEPLYRSLHQPLQLTENWNVRWLNNAALLLGLAGSVWLWRARQRGLALYALICILLPWSTGTLMSMARYVVSCVPLFFAFACWLERPRWWTAWIVISASLLVGMTACFTLGTNFAGA